MLRSRLRYSYIFFLAGFFVLLNFSGCVQMTTSQYESSVKHVLAEIEKKSDPIQQTIIETTYSATEDQKEKQENLYQRQIKILEDANSRLKSFDPPEELAAGHKDLISFTDHLIGLYEALKSNQDDSPQSSENTNKLLLQLTTTTRSFSDTSDKLPTLKNELSITYSNMLSQIQNNVFRKVSQS